MFHTMPSILRAPDSDAGGASESSSPESSTDIKPTEQSGDATNVQGAGASAGEPSAPEPSTESAETGGAADAIAAVIAKAKGAEPEAAATTDSQGTAPLSQERIDKILASIEAGIAAPATPTQTVAPTAPALPVAAAKPTPAATAQPKAESANEDFQKILAERFPDLEDFVETHPLVKHVLDLENKIASLTSQTAEQDGPSPRDRIEYAHRAINAIPNLDKGVFGEYGGRMSPKQIEKRVALDTLAAKFYQQIAAESNLASKNGIDRAEAEYNITQQALDAAHRTMTNRTSSKAGSVEADAINKLRHVSSTRSPAAISSGRTASTAQITDSDDGPTAIAKVLAAAGIGRK